MFPIFMPIFDHFRIDIMCLESLVKKLVHRNIAKLCFQKCSTLKSYHGIKSIKRKFNVHVWLRKKWAS